ncbi:MAG: permease prefix domain 1-containing protein, partial [Candidatus Sulfopaludibacter sp.]|nr:permease prefix domain 1-containing protein [Candidatus Sulfopaludibacter sp.]
MTSFFRKLSWFARRRRKEEELREELEFHLEEEAELRHAAGLAEQEARCAALRELGNVGLVQEETRAAWGWTWLEQLLQDSRYALRMMSTNKAFSALAILSLALGVGANTAIYSFMDAVLLRRLPIPDPESLVVVNWHTRIRHGDTVMHDMSGTTYDDRKTGTTAGIFPFPSFDLLRTSDAVFSSLFAYYPTRKVNLMVKGQAEQAGGEFVS